MRQYSYWGPHVWRQQHQQHAYHMQQYQGYQPQYQEYQPQYQGSPQRQAPSQWYQLQYQGQSHSVPSQYQGWGQQYAALQLQYQAAYRAQAVTGGAYHQRHAPPATAQHQLPITDTGTSSYSTATCIANASGSPANTASVDTSGSYATASYSTGTCIGSVATRG